MPFMVIGVKFN